MQIEQVLIVFVLPIIVGFFACGFANILYGAFAYGHILSFVRDWASVRTAKKLKVDQSYKEEYKNIAENKQWSFKEASAKISFMQSQLAKDSKLLTGLFCTDCMSSQYGIAFSILTTLCLSDYGLNWIMIILFVIFSGSAARMWNNTFK